MFQTLFLTLLMAEGAVLQVGLGRVAGGYGHRDKFLEQENLPLTFRLN